MAEVAGRRRARRDDAAGQADVGGPVRIGSTALVGRDDGVLELARHSCGHRRPVRVGRDRASWGHLHEGARLVGRPGRTSRRETSGRNRWPSFTSMSPSNAAATIAEIRREHVVAALPVEPAQACPDGREQSRRDPGRHRRRTWSCAGMRRRARRPAVAGSGLGEGIELRASAAVSSAVTRIRRRSDVGTGRRRDGGPDRRGVGQRRLDEDRPAVDQAGEGIAQRERRARRGAETRSTCRSSPCPRIGSSAMVRRVARRKALLLRPVPRVCLDLLAEDLAHDGREQLVRGDRPKAADRVAAEREGPRRCRCRSAEAARRADGGRRRPPNWRSPGWMPRDQSKTPARSAASTSRDPSPADDRDHPRHPCPVRRPHRRARPWSRESVGCRQRPARRCARRRRQPSRFRAPRRGGRPGTVDSW